MSHCPAIFLVAIFIFLRVLCMLYFDQQAHYHSPSVISWPIHTSSTYIFDGAHAPHNPHNPSLHHSHLPPPLHTGNSRSPSLFLLLHCHHEKLNRRIPLQDRQFAYLRHQVAVHSCRGGCIFPQRHGSAVYCCGVESRSCGMGWQ